jgi:hypothetical protein
MNALIEMHDSECIAIELNEDGGGFVLLDAYVHLGNDDPLAAPHEGGVQRVRINFAGMVIEGALDNLPADIADGSLVAGSDMHDNVFRLPAVYTGPVRLSMTLSGDARVIVVSGTRLSVEPEGEFPFIETVDFSS